MEKVIKILMERDGISREEAVSIVKECKKEMEDAIHDGHDPEEVFMDYCGLEPDFMLEVLFDTEVRS